MPAHYPTGILARDLAELVAHLGLDRLRPRRLLARRADASSQAVGEGLRPGRAILAGMGLDGLARIGTGASTSSVDAIANFDTASRGDPHWLAIQFMKTMKVDREAALLVLASFGDAIARLARGLHHADAGGVRQRGRGQWLGRASLPRRCPTRPIVEVPGTHMSSVTKPELGEAIARLPRGLTRPLPRVQSVDATRQS